ncbi:MAG: hypothetical protein ABI306_00880 [Caulobacteraceae bacterium]
MAAMRFWDEMNTAKVNWKSTGGGESASEHFKPGDWSADALSGGAANRETPEPTAAGVTLPPGAAHAAPPVTGPPTYYWAKAVSGNFDTGRDWRGGAALTSQDANAVLNSAGPAFTVTDNNIEILSSIQIASNATLEIKSGTFIATNGGANAGVISSTGFSACDFGGTFVNTGVIAIGKSPPGYGNELQIAQTSASGLTLTGGGKVELNDGLKGFIDAAGAYYSLTNVDNTFSGAGFIGLDSYKPLILDN